MVSRSTHFSKIGRTYGESVIGCFVLTDVVDQLTVESARNFTGRIWNEILRPTGVRASSECLLQTLALPARAF